MPTWNVIFAEVSELIENDHDLLSEKNDVVKAGAQDLEDPEKTDDKPEYWDFSFDEMGRFDLPANIDFVLEKTGKDKIIYIAHSQGTT